MLIAIVGPLILAEPLARALREPGQRKPRRGLAAGLAFALLLAALTALRLCAAARARPTAGRRRARRSPHVPASLVHAPVLNEYAFGGYLIFNDVRPFIDSRAELYGDRFLARYGRIIRPDKPLLEARSISTMCAGRSSPPAIRPSA